MNIFKHLSKNNKIMIKISNLSFYCNSFITLVRLKQNFQLYSCKLFCFFDEDHLGGIITGVEQLTETSHYHAQFPQHLNSSRNIFNTFSLPQGQLYLKVITYKMFAVFRLVLSIISYSIIVTEKQLINQVPVSNFK